MRRRVSVPAVVRRVRPCKDEKKAAAAEAEAVEAPRTREGARGQDQVATEQQLELEKLRDRVAEFESSRLPAHARRGGPGGGGAAESARDAAGGAGARRGIARHAAPIPRHGDGSAAPRDDRPAPAWRSSGRRRRRRRRLPPRCRRGTIQEQLDGAAEVEQVLRDELEASRARDPTRRARARGAGACALRGSAHTAGPARQVRAQARLAEEERQRILAEAAKSPTAAGDDLRGRRVADQGAHAAARTIGGRAGHAARGPSRDRLRGPEPSAGGRARGVARTARGGRGAPDRHAAQGGRTPV